MKSLKIVLVALFLIIAGTSGAQVSFGISIGTPPLWGPVGYSDARYYYLPDVEAYYDINAAMFIYLDGGNWVHRRDLPGRYGHYDLDHGYKVVMTGYHGDRPYSNFNEHRRTYSKGYRGAPQRTYREDKAQHRDNNGGNNRSNEHGNGHAGDDHGGKGKK